MDCRERGACPRGRGSRWAAAIALALVMIVSANAFAVIGDHIWSTRYAWGRTAAVDGSGSITTYGVFFGTIDFGGGPLTAQNNSTGDVFLAHFDAGGNHLWSQQFTPVGGNGLFNFVMAVAPGGDIYLSGRIVGGSFDFGGGPIAGAPQAEGVLACFDATGNHQWSFGFGTGEVLDLAANDTKLVAVGEIQVGAGVDFGGGALVSAGGEDVFVVQLSPAGVEQWSRRFGDSGRQSSEAVAIDAAGNVVFAGSTLGTVDFGGGPTTPTGIEYFVAKRDPSGAHLWSRNLTGTVAATASIRHGLELAAGPSNELLLCGNYRGDIDLGAGSVLAVGSDDLFLARYDPNGDYQWGLVHGNTSADAATAVDVDSGGNVLITAYFNGPLDFGGGPLPSIGPSRNVAAVVYDPSGSHLFSAAYGTGSEIYGRFDAGNDLLLDGGAGTVDFGGGLISGGSFLAKLDGTPNTPIGSSVPVVPFDETTGSAPVSMVFDDVTAAGNTSLITSAVGPPPPASLSFGDLTTYYEISTSASFTGNVEICIEYDEASIPGAESELSLQHYDAAIPGWQDVTTSRDEINNVLCGVVSSLSPFALAVPVPPVDAPPSPESSGVFVLRANAPNPFNPSTSIFYDVPAGGGRVELAVYDVSGRLVRTLVSGTQSAGRKSVRWDGRDRFGGRVASGVYLYRLQARDYDATRKMVLVE